jgi:hypothetical protein
MYVQSLANSAQQRHWDPIGQFEEEVLNQITELKDFWINFLHFFLKNNCFHSFTKKRSTIEPIKKIL